MARIPIYQMTFGQDNKGNPGLVFASEQESNDNQSILFTIPIIESFRHPFDLLKFLDNQTIYFPFLLGEQYFDLVAKVNFPELIFKIPEKDIQVTFEIDNVDFFDWQFYRLRRRPFRKIKYVGKQGNLLLKNIGFLTLMPIDLYEMDELYNNHKGVFVGLTPNFGNSNFESNRG